jgi:HAD superfamily phosphoserine phosphatase-like hydrolase
MVAFDLDGTLTRGNCLETLAGRFGFAEQMARWEQATTDNEIVEARSALRRLLAGYDLDEQIAALASIPLAPGASDAVAVLCEAGIPTVIVTLAFAPHAAWFAQKLGIDHVIGTELLSRHDFRHVFPGTKPTLLTEHAAAFGIDPADIVAFGDTPGDVPMLRAVGTSIYVGHALPEGFRPTAHLPDTALDTIIARIETIRARPVADRQEPQFWRGHSLRGLRASAPGCWRPSRAAACSDMVATRSGLLRGRP